MNWLIVATVGFVGSHLLLSQSLRPALVRRMGEKGFAGLYVVVAFVTFGLMIWAYRSLGREIPLWTAGDGIWLVGSLLMWLAAILFVGSFSGNPALPRRPGSGAAVVIREPHGVFTITRHPMNWSFAIWALVHAAVVATPKALVFDGAIFFLAVVGSALQDRKKAEQFGERWHSWTGATAFLPFSRGAGNPGAIALIGGTILFFLVTWLHQPIAGIPAGFWRWIG